MTTALPFNEQFDQHAAWRREFALRLKQLAQWMKAQGLLNAAVEERMLRLQEQVGSDKVMVAFVAKFSRGKSELINASSLPATVAAAAGQRRTHHHVPDRSGP